MCFGSSTQNVVQSTEIPDWLLPYYQTQAEAQQQLLPIAQQIYQDNAAYDPYPNARLQDFTTDQLTAQEMARRNLGLETVQNPDGSYSVAGTGQPAVGQAQLSAAVDRGTQGARTWTETGGSYYEPDAIQAGQVGTTYTAPGLAATRQDQARDVSASTVDTSGIGIGPLSQVSTSDFDAAAAERYMDPYRQQVIDRTVAEMERSNDRRRLSDQGRAAKAGAYGGSRHGVVDALREEDFDRTLGNTVAQLYDTGYGRAIDQYNTDEGRDVQTQVFNVGTDLDRQGRNQQTGLQGLLANQGATMQAQTANQASDLTRYGADQAAENDMTRFGADLGLRGFGANAAVGAADADRALTADRSNQETGLQAFNANREQFNTDQGRMLQSAALSAGFGSQAQDMGLKDVASLMTIGDTGQAMGQAGLDMMYDDYLRQKANPYQQFSWLQGALSGQPVENPSLFATQTSQQPAASPFAQMAGAGLAALGTAGALGWAPFCWVAREVYGAKDPRWKRVRDIVLGEAPAALVEAYARHGAALADFIRDKPALKRAIRAEMDALLETRDAVPA